MKVNVDFSVFTEEEGAFGSVSGEINVNSLPQIGDSVSFLFADKNVVFDPAIGFSGMFKVTDRIITANREDQKLVLALSDVVVQSKTDALKLTQYFESGFNLFAEIYAD